MKDGLCVALVWVQDRFHGSDHTALCLFALLKKGVSSDCLRFGGLS